MTVQRQYTLPNCNLIVEGLSAGGDADPTAPLTVVLNTECHFSGMTDTLRGGREFLDALVKTVSDYGQSILSGITYPTLQGATEADLVVLKPGDSHRHCLTADVVSTDDKPLRKTLNLSTVQLFDLMEAVDRFLTDTQTLPETTLQLSPLNRRHVRSAEPATQRVVPVAAGLSALAASAALFFVMPVPEVEIERTREEQDSSALVEEGTTTTVPADGETPPPATDSASSEVETPTTASPESTEAEVEPTQTATDPVSAATALTRLSTAPEITDPDAIARLETELEDTLEAELPEAITFEESLVYRVAISESGDLLGYKYENDAALRNVNDTPLPELTFIPVDPDQAVEEPVTQFRVTINSDGEVTAEPFSPEE